MGKQCREKPLYEAVFVNGKQRYQCCQCGRLNDKEVNIAVHIFYHHPHLRVR